MGRVRQLPEGERPEGPTLHRWAHHHRHHHLFSTSEQLLSRNVERFREGLVFKAHRLLHDSTVGSRVIKKKEKKKSPPDTGTSHIWVESHIHIWDGSDYIRIGVGSAFGGSLLLGPSGVMVRVRGFRVRGFMYLSPRKVDIRLPGKGNSNSHGARQVY